MQDVPHMSAHKKYIFSENILVSKFLYTQVLTKLDMPAKVLYSNSVHPLPERACISHQNLDTNSFRKGRWPRKGVRNRVARSHKRHDGPADPADESIRSTEGGPEGVRGTAHRRHDPQRSPRAVRNPAHAVRGAQGGNAKG